MRPDPIINLGLPKSGTTTLGEALRSAGYVVADHIVRRDEALAPGEARKPIARLLYDGYFETGDPLKYLRRYDALSEISILRPNLSLWPQTDPGLLQALRSRHPQARFVLSLRPAKDIVSSMLRWGNLGRQRMPNGAIPGLPKGYGQDPRHLLRFVAAHHGFVKAWFAGDPRFLALEMAAPDARQQLAEFLGRDVPWWGRANQNPKGTRAG